MTHAITVNKSGQSLGRKGRQTRANIIAGANYLLRETPMGGLTVAAIAKQADISAPTFYLYFEDVGEVLLAVLDEVAHELDGVLAKLVAPWPAERTYGCALAFVQAYFELWIRHGALLRARNQLADQADPRFMKNRYESAMQFAAALGDKFQDIKRGDTGDVITSVSLSGVIITSLERLATVVALEYYSRGVVRWEDSSRALAHLIADSVNPLHPVASQTRHS
jgi:AcrR family transcriptional regulator